MYIQRAIKLALEQNACIARPWFVSAIQIKPIHKDDLLLVIKKKSTIGRRWQPTARDLLANDWLVTAEGTEVSSPGN